jgi:hypothetical protein
MIDGIIHCRYSSPFGFHYCHGQHPKRSKGPSLCVCVCEYYVLMDQMRERCVAEHKVAGF